MIYQDAPRYMPKSSQDTTSNAYSTTDPSSRTNQSKDNKNLVASPALNNWILEGQRSFNILISPSNASQSRQYFDQNRANCQEVRAPRNSAQVSTTQFTQIPETMTYHLDSVDSCKVPYPESRVPEPMAQDTPIAPCTE